jgi:hypothetical protein
MLLIATYPRHGPQSIRKHTLIFGGSALPQFTPRPFPLHCSSALVYMGIRYTAVRVFECNVKPWSYLFYQQGWKFSYWLFLVSSVKKLAKSALKPRLYTSEAQLWHEVSATTERLTDILFIPQMIWVGEDGGMILTGENRRTRRETCPSATLSTTNTTWTDPGANQGGCHSYMS